MDYEIAQEYYLRVIALDENSDHALMMLGNIALQRFMPMDAKEYYLRALALNPNSDLLKENMLLAEESIARAKKTALLHGRTELFFYGGIGLGCGAILWICLLELMRIRRKTHTCA